MAFFYPIYFIVTCSYQKLLVKFTKFPEHYYLTLTCQCSGMLAIEWELEPHVENVNK